MSATKTLQKYATIALAVVALVPLVAGDAQHNHECGETQYFSHDTNTCIDCPAGWIANEHDCEEPGTDTPSASGPPVPEEEHDGDHDHDESAPPGLEPPHDGAKPAPPSVPAESDNTPGPQVNPLTQASPSPGNAAPPIAAASSASSPGVIWLLLFAGSLLILMLSV